ncbi:MAG: ParB/RepB/Spo0J family partition protein [Proteobacteria bacterium]|nr:ParB/RepB/Spo0J family partition protein [Pseudomonadota bacterium]
MATKKTVESPEFLYLPLSDIVIEEQIRSGIDTESESFKALMESIKDLGVLEPVLVTPKDGKYLLLCGERRYLAALKLGLPTIPVRILDTITQKDEILAYQLTENLQREDLNPMDQAKGIFAYIQAKHPDKNYDVDGVMSDLVSYNRRPEDLPEEIALTVRAIIEIAGKSIQTLHRTISLLKLSDEIQAAIRVGNLPVSQGYIFAANLDCPDRMNIFATVIQKPVTNATLNNLLTAYKKVKPVPGVTKPIPMTKQIASLRSVESSIETGIATYTKPDLVTLLDELHVFCALVELRIPIAPEPAPEKPGKKKPPQV